jgi:hypothetical protein
MRVTMSQQPSRPGHPRFEPDDQPSLQTNSQPSRPGHPRFEPDDQPSLQTDLAQRNRWTRRILLGIVAALALATFLAGIRW